MKEVLLYLFLLSAYPCGLYGQDNTNGTEGCDYRSRLEYFKNLDTQGKLTNPELLFEAALTASNADDFALTENYYRRITNEHTVVALPTYYLAKAYLAMGYDKSIDLHQLQQDVLNNLGRDHDLHAVINLVKADQMFRAKKVMALDSMVRTQLSRIHQPERYKKVIAISLQNVSREHADKGRFQESISAAAELVAFVSRYFPPCSEEVSTAYITRGRRFLDAHQPDSAAFYIEKAYHLASAHREMASSSLVKAAINYSDIKREQAQFDEAIRLLEEAESLALEDSVVASKMLTVIYSNFGGIYKAIGSYNKAIEYYRKGILNEEKYAEEISVNKIATYFNIGTQFQELGNIELSKQYRKKALKMARSLLGEEHRFVAIILMSLGSLEFEKKNYAACEDYYNQSLKIRQKIYGDQHTSLANVYFNFSHLYQQKGDYDQARHYSGKVTEMYKAQFGEDHPQVAHSLLRQADIEYTSGNDADALSFLKSAKAILDTMGGYHGSTHSLLYLDVVDNKAIVKLDHLISSGQGDIDAIVEDFEEAMQVFDYHINRSEEVADISRYATSYPNIFDRYVQALLYKAKSDGGESIKIEAFKVNDKGKNLGLFKSLSERSRLIFANVPQEVRTRLKTLKGAINAIDQQLYAVNPNEEAQRTALLDSLVSVQEELQQLNDQIKTSYPSYSQLSHLDQTVDISSIMPEKGSQRAIIDIRIVDSTLISFSLFEGELRTYLQKLPPDFDKLLAGYFEDISKPKKLPELSQVNDVLLQPIRELPMDINQLTIIPDKYLSAFPFESLKIEGRYLIEQYAVSYAHSASILAFQNQLNPSGQKNTIAGFAPFYGNTVDTSQSDLYAKLVRSGNWELPFAQEEVKFITDLLEGSAYTGKQANKANFIQALRESQIVHLSMHAEADNVQPMNSRFIFDSESENEVNNLLLYELYNLQANTNLAVLSACETGQGAFSTGDGVRSLGNGFLYAGVPSVVMSLWKVPDESTSIIMKAFYQHLKAGDPKSVALQKAKVDYLQNTIAPEQKHPYYWAGFVLSGNDEPLVFKQIWGFKSIGFLLLLGAFVFWLFYIRK